MISRSKGFTLIEITAVVVLMALLAGAVSATFFSWHSQAQMASVIGKLKHFDRVSREYARMSGRPAKLVIRAVDNQLIYTEGLVADIGIFNEESQSPNLQVLNLPDGYWLERIVVDDYEGDIGEEILAVSSKGQTPTYGLMLMNDKNEEYWLVFVGMTGQIIESEDDFKVQDIFSLLASGGRVNLD